MIVKPRKVEPGWLIRWPKDAFLLMSRAWILWIGIAALVAVCGHGMQVPVLGILTWPLSLVVFVIATDLARVSDQKFVTGTDVLNVLQRSLAISLECLKRRWISLVAVSAVVSFGWLAGNDMTLTQKIDAISYGAAAPPNIGPDDLWTWLFSARSPLVYAALVAFIGGGFLQTMLLPGFVGCLFQTFGKLDPSAIDLLLANAFAMNRNAAMLLCAYMGLFVALALMLPLAGWVFSVFTPPLVYVAFREMFVDGDGNRKRAPRTVSERQSTIAANAA
jgi:hypothetical protein